MRRERHGSRVCAVGGAFDISAPPAVAAPGIAGGQQFRTGRRCPALLQEVASFPYRLHAALTLEPGLGQVFVRRSPKEM